MFNTKYSSFWPKRKAQSNGNTLCPSLYLSLSLLSNLKTSPALPKILTALFTVHKYSSFSTQLKFYFQFSSLVQMIIKHCSRENHGDLRSSFKTLTVQQQRSFSYSTYPVYFVISLSCKLLGGRQCLLLFFYNFILPNQHPHQNFTTDAN